MSHAASVDLQLSADGRIATVVLSEPRLNLLTTPLLDDLLALGPRLHALPALRLVVLRGAGNRAFIGGADIREMAAFMPQAALAFIDRIHQLCHLLRTLPVPSIARVQGFCLGAGMEVAASCDLRIGSEDSRYGMPEVQVGLPSVVEARLLPTLIGWGRTRELLYTGAIIDAPEAHRIGFLERMAPADGLDTAMQPWVDAILAAEPGAIRAQKRLIEGWLESGVAAGVQAGMDAFAETFRSDAPNRRLRAFLERPRGR